MSNFDEKLKEILFTKVRFFDSKVEEEVVAQIKQLISEVIGEDENISDAVKRSGIENDPLVKDLIDIQRSRNDLRDELRHAFNLKGE